MSKIAQCPNDPVNHTTFTTTAHEQHVWKVNQRGEFIEDLECIDVTHEPYPGNGNYWNCTRCGQNAVFVPDPNT